METNNKKQTASDYESVNLLFGLSPSEFKSLLQFYYDSERICSVAIMEIIEECQKQGKCSDFTLPLSRDVAITVELDRMNQLYNCLEDDDELKDDDETATKINEHLLRIIKKIDELNGGIYDFLDNIQESVMLVKTKKAYEDIVLAAFCMAKIYIAYERNVRENQAFGCIATCRR